LRNSLRTWFFTEPCFERFSVEPEIVLLWHHSEEPFSVPDITSMLLCEPQVFLVAGASVDVTCNPPPPPLSGVNTGGVGSYVYHEPSEAEAQP